MIPVHFGDPRNIVAILHLDIESLTFLANEGQDGFFRECAAVLDEVQKRLAYAKEAAEAEPGLSVVVQDGEGLAVNSPGGARGPEG